MPRFGGIGVYLMRIDVTKKPYQWAILKAAFCVGGGVYLGLGIALFRAGNWDGGLLMGGIFLLMMFLAWTTPGKLTVEPRKTSS